MQHGFCTFIRFDFGEFLKNLKDRSAANVALLLYCALGRERGPSAPRVEHRYNAGGGGIKTF